MSIEQKKFDDPVLAHRRLNTLWGTNPDTCAENLAEDPDFFFFEAQDGFYDALKHALMAHDIDRIIDLVEAYDTVKNHRYGHLYPQRISHAGLGCVFGERYYSALAAHALNGGHKALQLYKALDARLESLHKLSRKKPLTSIFTGSYPRKKEALKTQIMSIEYEITERGQLAFGRYEDKTNAPEPAASN